MAPVRTPLALSVALSLAAFQPSAAAAQSVIFAGTVTDSLTGTALADARISVFRSDMTPVGSTVSDYRGRFHVSVSAPATYVLRVRRVGFRVWHRDAVAVGTDGTTLAVLLIPLRVPLDPVVVSVARTQETALSAPASVSVVSRADIQRTSAFSPVDHVRDVAGVDFATKGLVQHTLAVRGARGVNSAALLVLQDFRQAGIPSLRLNVPYLVPVAGDDLDRIEVLRGPGAAIYGPDSDRGVVHLITRSPFDSRGGQFAFSGGERSVFNASARGAGVFSERLAVRVGADYLRGNDWETIDSLEVVARADAISAGADPDTVLIGRRDHAVERFLGQVRVEWRPAGGTRITADAGASHAFNLIDLTGAGATQVRDWRNAFVQGRLRHGRLFANVVVNASDAGQTYQLRTGQPIVDESRLIIVQLQHGADAGPTRLVYGADARWTNPRTGGTIHGRNESDDLIAEAGAYVSTTTVVGSRLDAVAALRVDHHSRIDDPALSPRAGLVLRATPAHVFRVTYNRAYNTPTADGFFLDLRAGALPGGLPFAIRAVGVPQTGYTFARDCGGLCMRSPFSPVPQLFLPADATMMWPAVVAILQQQGVDLSALPSPTATAVTTDLRMLNLGTQGFDPIDPATVVDVPPLGREVTNAFEVGYKGVLADRVFMGIDAYVNRVSNVRGTLAPGTPQVFLNQESLEQYLTTFMSGLQAAQLAANITQIPLGTISPREARDPTDILLINGRGGGGHYTFWGVDVSIDAQVSDHITARAAYSWTSKDSVAGVANVPDFALNAPRNKASAALSYRHDGVGLDVDARGRLVDDFPVASGVYRGTVDAYAVLDVTAGYRLVRGLRLSVTAFNLLDQRHGEFVGAPVLGRLIISRLEARF